VLLSPVTPGTSSIIPFQLFAAGVLATNSPLMICWRAAFCTSTTGVSPVTVMVSASAPTFSSALICTVPEPASSTPSRLTTLKPVRLNVTLYVPGRRSTILYWPLVSVVTERTFSMSEGLAASTVTPGSTAPDVSLTTPARDPWAAAKPGKITTRAAAMASGILRIDVLTSCTG
jgi:hypothetical protein